MKRDPVAAAILEFEGLGDPTRQFLARVADVSRKAVQSVVRNVDLAMGGDARRRIVMDDLIWDGERMRRSVADASTEIAESFAREIVSLKRELWQVSLPPEPPPRFAFRRRGAGFRRGGHLCDFELPGEPALQPGIRYEPAPLVMPRVPIDIDIARQGPLFNCYFIAAINAVAQWHPDAVADMVKPDPGDANVVIVTVHGGTYRLPATLPVDERTGTQVHSTSPDGSNIVAYLEKAAAAHMGTWDDLALGDAYSVLQWLIGDKYARFNSVPVSEMTDAFLQDVLRFETPVIVNTPGVRARPHRLEVFARLGLIESHAYTVNAGVPIANGLHNPHGGLHPRALTARELREADVTVQWASRPIPPFFKEDVT